MNTITWDLIVNLMDDNKREELHRKLATNNEFEFLAAYLQLDPEFRKTLQQEFPDVLQQLR